MVRKIIKETNKSIWSSVWTNKYFYILNIFYWFIALIVTISNGELGEIVYDIVPLFFAIILIGLLFSLLFTLFLFINRDRKKKDFPIKSWEWIFYIIGWLTASNILFWIIQYIAWLMYNRGDRFYTMNFHWRTYEIGVWIIGFIFLSSIIGSILSS